MAQQFSSALGTEGDLVKTIADQIRGQIVDGVLQPGERIYEAQLARQYGAGRAVLREAARILEREGLLHFQLNKGFLVREPTVRELIDLTETRICVERHAIRIVANLERREEVIAALNAAVAEITACVAEHDYVREVAADFKFHRLIVEYAGNKRMLAIYDQLSTELRISIRMMGFFPDLWDQLPELHRSVVRIIAEGNPADAEAAIEQHIRESWEETLERIPSRMDVSLGALLNK